MSIACAGMEYDYPLRVKAVKGNVVHAGKTRMMRGYSRTRRNPETGKYEIFEKIPDREAVVTACKPYNEREYVQVDSSEEITCKNCLRRLTGYEDVKKDVFRYVLQEKASDYFYKKTGWKSSWVADFRIATMYQTEHAAASKGRKRYYKNKVDNKNLSVDEFRALPQSEKHNYDFVSELDRERYIVRRVRMELE